MFCFIQNIITNLLELQEKLLKRSTGKNFSASYKNGTTTKILTKCASLELSSKTEKNKQKLDQDIKSILKKYENDTEKLLNFVERSGTPVYKIPFAGKFLKLINLEEGLIMSNKGLKGLYLNILTSLLSGKKINLSLNCDTIFVISNIKPDNYYTIQQFHKWYAMKLKLPGFGDEAQNNFQKFITGENCDMGSLSIEEILDLKEAIARDVEAINFIVDLAKSTTGSKKALAKMSTGGANI